MWYHNGKRGARSSWSHGQAPRDLKLTCGHANEYRSWQGRYVFSSKILSMPFKKSLVYTRSVCKYCNHADLKSENRGEIICQNCGAVVESLRFELSKEQLTVIQFDRGFSNDNLSERIERQRKKTERGAR